MNRLDRPVSSSSDECSPSCRIFSRPRITIYVSWLWLWRWNVVIVLACISPATTELFAPATRYVDMQFEQESIIAFVALSVVTHVAHGHVADVFGWQLLAKYGLVVYVCTSASIASIADQPAETGMQSLNGRGQYIAIVFLLLRIFQGVGASACTVASLACVRICFIDLHIVYTARSIVLVIVPMASELACSMTSDWRAAFWMMAAGGGWGIVLLFLGLFFKKPNLAPTARSSTDGQMTNDNIYTHAHTHDAIEVEVTASGQVRLENAITGAAPAWISFVVWIVVDALGFGAMFVWIAYAPVVVDDIDHFGYYYGLTFVGSVVGSVIAQYTTVRTVGPAIVLQLLFTLTSAFLLDDGRGANEIPAHKYEYYYVVIVLMTLFNCARGVAASHANVQAMASPVLTPGHTSGALHGVRMAVTTLMLICALSSSAWGVVVFALCTALATLVFVPHQTVHNAPQK